MEIRNTWTYGRDGVAYHSVRHNIILSQQSLQMSSVSFADIVMILLLIHAGPLVTEDGHCIKLVAPRGYHVARPGAGRL